MASQVLSGASNPSYTNNTGQNVRIVINYMQGSPYTPAVPASQGNPRAGIPGFPGRAPINSDLTINWAGVSATSSSSAGEIVIGRNLAYSTLYREVASGGVQAIIGTNSEGFRIIEGNVPISASVSLAVGSNNAAGSGVALPTEIMIAPGQTFSAVCRIYNIVVIPEAG
jgi:hypothetical protein